MMTKSSKHCGHCGNVGHSIRTCNEMKDVSKRRTIETAKGGDSGGSRSSKREK